MGLSRRRSSVDVGGRREATVAMPVRGAVGFSRGGQVAPIIGCKRRG